MEELLIEPGRSFKHYWHDLWRYRELFYILAWRDIKARYKQKSPLVRRTNTVWSLI